MGDDDLTEKLASVAMTEELDRHLRKHLVRADGQEEICFALYSPSRGAHRFTALVTELILPSVGDRQIHGTASFNPRYFDRVLSQAATANGMGIAFLHTHPQGRGWQPMSATDHEAEAGMAGAVFGATGQPLVGLTLSGGTGFWSARQWYRKHPHKWASRDCENVRVVGVTLTPWVCPRIKPILEIPATLMRTAHAWGDALQELLSRVRVGIVGLGSVGSVVSEALTRMGFTELVMIDPDIIKVINLDRTLHAYPEQVVASELKAVLASRSAARAATMRTFRVRTVPLRIQDTRAYRAALDCDVIFSCVDRPWPRSILNFIAYAHLIPVIDGGIDVSKTSEAKLRSADWGAFVVGPSRRCLECSRQYSSSLVAVVLSDNYTCRSTTITSTH